MIAIDTDLVVRYLADDDRQQSPRAKSLIAENDVWLPTTVLLEAGWVLRSVHGLSDAETARALCAFVGLPTVSVQSPTVAAQAFEWAERGMDFADALHLAAAAGCEAFTTFDERLIKAAARGDGIEVRRP
jgi:predicted nucleic-acid-binding protein